MGHSLGDPRGQAALPAGATRRSRSPDTQSWRAPEPGKEALGETVTAMRPEITGGRVRNVDVVAEQELEGVHSRGQLEDHLGLRHQNDG